MVSRFYLIIISSGSWLKTRRILKYARNAIFPKNFSSVSKDWTLFQLFNPTIRAKTLQSVNSRQDYKSRLSGVSINCITRNCSMVVVQGFASKSFGGPSGPRWIAIQGGGSWVRSGFAFMAFDHAIPRYEGHRR